jgi:hypothetical protein
MARIVVDWHFRGLLADRCLVAIKEYVEWCFFNVLVSRLVELALPIVQCLLTSSVPYTCAKTSKSAS